MYGGNEKQKNQPVKGKSFLASGFGYWMSFIVLGLLAVLLLGGSAETSTVKTVVLFAAGGFIGLAILAVYNKVGSL